MVSSFLGMGRLSRDFTEHLSKQQRVPKPMEEEREQRKPHFCPMNLETFLERERIQYKNLNNHGVFESKPQNSECDAWTMLLLKFASDNPGSFSLLTSSKPTFLETFVKMLITEGIWSPLCLKKAPKKLELVHSNVQVSGRVTWWRCALRILNSQATFHSNTEQKDVAKAYHRICKYLIITDVNSESHTVNTDSVRLATRY